MDSFLDFFSFFFQDERAFIFIYFFNIVYLNGCKNLILVFKNDKILFFFFIIQKVELRQKNYWIGLNCSLFLDQIFF